MRVLLLITDLQLGGTPTVVRELAIRTRRTGLDIEVACLSNWGPVADQLKNAGVPVTALNAKGARDLLVLQRLIRLVRDRKFNTVFSFLMHANAMAAAASLVVHDVRWIQSLQTTQPHPRWHWVVQRIAQRAADAIVVPSPSVARAAIEWAGVPEAKIVVIPNAIDPADWTAWQSPVPATDPRPYPITFLGRLDPVKDVPTLVHAVALLNASSTNLATSTNLVHLHIYGEGSDRSRIEQAIARRHAAVTLHGAVQSPQAVLSRSGLLVLPSLAEGFGLVLIEAMAAGVPVVATDVPGIRDVVRHNITGILIPPGDAERLSLAIRRVIEQKAFRERLIDQAQNDVNSHFNWNTALLMYRKLLGI